MKKTCLYLILFLYSGLHAQEQAYLSGQLQINGNLFLEDDRIGASNTPQYDHQLVGADTWLDLNYQIKGFDIGARIDIFNNSNLLNPRNSYSDQGLGKWYVKKQVDKLFMEIGYIYDQIGSGLIFRSYEERPLLIDNGLYGVSATYELQPDWRIKVFGGKQKNLFETYESFIKGVVIDGYLSIGEENKVALVPGFGVINKTFSDDQIDELISTVRTYTPQDSLGLYYNSYAASIYNTLSFGPITWYVEGAVKTRDIYFDPDAERSLYTGENTLGRFRNDAGSVLYSSLGFGKKGFGASFEYKRTENFSFRADPFTALNRGIVNYLPPMSKINTYRLKSRYTPAPRELAEEAIQVEIRYTPVKKWRIVHYFSNITDLSGNQLYREIDNEINFRPSVANQITFGIQAQTYNQAIYEGKSGVPNVKTVTPYFEWFRKLSARKSMKIEAQFMSTKQDFGSWAFALIEYSIAPRWSFALSDMYNVDPIKTAALHYPRVDVVFVQKTNRFGLSYIKQVEGVVCAGGICRLEPAFSGIRFSLNSTF